MDQKSSAFWRKVEERPTFRGWEEEREKGLLQENPKTFRNRLRGCNQMPNFAKSKEK
jgi:hypothetical protein